jgi:hypothetical protein
MSLRVAVYDGLCEALTMNMNKQELIDAVASEGGRREIRRS